MSFQHQYIYVHEAVADALLFGTQSLWSKQFDEVYCFLNQFEPGTDFPRLRTQYDVSGSDVLLIRWNEHCMPYEPILHDEVQLLLLHICTVALS